MKLSILLLAVLTLRAEDAAKVLPPNEHELLIEARAQLAEAQAELRLYQQGLFQCQAAGIHQQAVTQAAAQSKRPEKEKPAK